MMQCSSPTKECKKTQKKKKKSRKRRSVKFDYLSVS